MMQISVLIPTYRRTSDLTRCLHALERQLRPPDDVILVVRTSDEETSSFLETHRFDLPLRQVPVDEGGQVKALNAGLDAASGDIVMITDDDTMPHAHWILKAEQHFLVDPTLGGVGGRDVVHHGSRIEEGPCKVVGKLMWFGRLTGNHHLIAPGRAHADVLKGANMSYRMQAVGSDRFDTHLRGSGAQVGNDMAFSLAMRKKGWKLLYDPEVSLDHFPAKRHDNDQRGVPKLETTADISFNTWWILQKHLRFGWRRWTALGWEAVIGVASRPGELRSLRAWLTRDIVASELGRAARCGRWQARQAYRAFLQAQRDTQT